MADLICLLLAMFGQLFTRGIEGSLLGVEFDETGQEFLNEYLSLDEGKYFTELQDFQKDTTIEIDLIDQKKKHRLVHQSPRVLYQIGVSLLFRVADHAESPTKINVFVNCFAGLNQLICWVKSQSSIFSHLS